MQIFEKFIFMNTNVKLDTNRRTIEVVRGLSVKS